MKRLVASILLALSGGVALAADDFVISDIRVDGLERISAGTVYTYLPVQKGDKLDRSRAADALRALYKTGFFKDVRLDRQGDILVVTVAERPAIATITLVGNKDIKTEELTKGLNNIDAIARAPRGDPAACTRPPLRCAARRRAGRGPGPRGEIRASAKDHGACAGSAG